MKSERRSYPRSAQASRRRAAGNGNGTLVETKCLACGQFVDAMMDGSLEPGEPALPSRSPVERTRGRVAKKPPSKEVDLEKVLNFSQRLYAHALTLQELIRNEGEATYEALRPRYDRQAAQQFEVFFRTMKRARS